MVQTIAVALVFQCSTVEAVSIGSSSIINTLDYSDTFTVNGDSRPEDELPSHDGTSIQSTYGNGPVYWTPNGWRIVTDTSQSVSEGASDYPGTSGSGSATGMLQIASQAGHWGIDYTTDGVTGSPALRSSYLVQIDAVMTNGRVEITSKATAGSLFSDVGSLSVFFRQTGDSLGISIYDSVHHETQVAEAPAGLLAGSWQNLAVEFSATGLKIYTNELLITTVDLQKVGQNELDYTGYSQQAVGFGFSSSADSDRAWFDNFQVGLAVPEPHTHSLLLACAVFALLHRKLGNWRGVALEE